MTSSSNGFYFFFDSSISPRATSEFGISKDKYTPTTGPALPHRSQSELGQAKRNGSSYDTFQSSNRNGVDLTGKSYHRNNEMKAESKRNGVVVNNGFLVNNRNQNGSQYQHHQFSTTLPPQYSAPIKESSYKQQHKSLPQPSKKQHQHGNKQKPEMSHKRNGFLHRGKDKKGSSNGRNGHADLLQPPVNGYRGSNFVNAQQPVTANRGQNVNVWQLNGSRAGDVHMLPQDDTQFDYEVIM